MPSVTTIQELMGQDAKPPRARRRGLVLVNTGNGKGKTSAGLGVVFRALGWNWRVRVVQFIKGKWTTGEKRICDALPLDVELYPLGDGFTWDTQNPEQDIRTTDKTWAFAREMIECQEYDLVVLDEINYVLHLQYLSVEPLIESLSKRPPWLHVICTGRNAPQELIEFADLVTEMREIKHPYKAGINAQSGIEY